MSSSISRRERRKFLRQMGLKNISQLKTSEGVNYNIDEGKKRHRAFLQEIKNKEIQEKSESIVKEEPFIYKGIQTPEYSNFHSMLINRDWNESDENAD